MGQLDELTVKVTADTTELEEALTRVERKAERLTLRVQWMMGQLAYLEEHVPDQEGEQSDNASS